MRHLSTKLVFTYVKPRLTSIITTALLSLVSISSNVAAESRGEILYQDNCAICHGSEGDGGIGIPLALTSFLDSASDDYLKHTIRLGRPGRIMPSFYRLSDTDVNDIIHFIGSWRKSPAPVWSTEKIDGNAKKGEQLFQKNCASCHGKSAGGGKGTGKSFSRPKDLPVTAPALNNQGFLHSASDAMLHYVIEHGRQETPMPSAKNLGLNDTDINNLVSYIRSFQKTELKAKSLYDSEPASLIFDSPYNFEETVDNVKRSIVGMNFLHIRDQSLLEGFTVKEKPGFRQTMIYFCNFSFLDDALKIDPRVGMFLPCRITVTEAQGKVQMMSINPKHLSQLFNNNELDQACNEMYDVYIGILEDASL